MSGFPQKWTLAQNGTHGQQACGAVLRQYYERNRKAIKQIVIEFEGPDYLSGRVYCSQRSIAYYEAFRVNTEGSVLVRRGLMGRTEIAGQAFLIAVTVEAQKLIATSP